MKNAQKYLDEIKMRLKEIGPYKIILFGSERPITKSKEMSIGKFALNQEISPGGELHTHVNHLGPSCVVVV